MRDHFGADAPSEGSTSTPPPPPVVAAPAPVVPPPAPGTPTPTLQQAVDKAVAKADADAKVAADPHAKHSVVLGIAAPTNLVGAAGGAGLGFLLGGPPGAAVGAAVGYLAERYQVGGGPITFIKTRVGKLFHKH